MKTGKWYDGQTFFSSVVGEAGERVERFSCVTARNGGAVELSHFSGDVVEVDDLPEDFEHFQFVERYATHDHFVTVVSRYGD